jgi:mannose-1-phosphate guanylyltransferase
MSEMNKNRYVVIMAGGVGTRFWPMSRTPRPKQFIDILGVGRTLLQQTFDRALSVCPKENIHIVTNAMYADLVKEQLPDLNDDQIVGEPARRNTAPCIAYAAFRIFKMNPDAVMTVAPSDHLILNTQEYASIISRGMDLASKEDCLITMGITPSRPDTGYGYIQFKDSGSGYDTGFKNVKTFAEKPDLETAKVFLESGEFLWNSGIFIWSAKSILSAMQEFLEDEVYDVLNENSDAYCSDDEAAFIAEAYPRCKSISIDYGVMERAENVYTIASDFGWSDLGTWGSLYAYSDKDEEGNVIQAEKLIKYDTNNCVVNVPKDKLVVLNGLKDMIVVENDNMLLVCKLEDEQRIKQIVADVKDQQGQDYV